MQWRKKISGLTSLMVWGMAVLLAICLVSAHINPSVISLLGILTLFTPFIILLNILAVIY